VLLLNGLHSPLKQANGPHEKTVEARASCDGRIRLEKALMRKIVWGKESFAQYSIRFANVIIQNPYHWMI